MKTPLMQTLAWIAAVGAALFLAWVGPDEASLLRNALPEMPRIGGR
ncbi:MAG TPA: hypothetical protein VLJ58_14655 [Ramlibacter sp.]|nr:hypothetical protein [Ramlibacter sp.]